jgi:Ca2+-binding EF-hand superfamily protein
MNNDQLQQELYDINRQIKKCIEEIKEENIDTSKFTKVMDTRRSLLDKRNEILKKLKTIEINIKEEKEEIPHGDIICSCGKLITKGNPNFKRTMVNKYCSTCADQE